ncbi:AraC family transcriptional regulator [Enterococcus sp. JM4C]|uniref:AraC family transcriptional regulator n=1 Tax=Candidatus Enterococcus huntleyi TaxID=1857217 RepID=UPI00137A9414|nr:AraC family transcriptional regulator [Enterococcus sp. JM4C]KAF1298478.1 AraC family transcriptional regulator [Enterococcus sp. JM4C]
MENFIFTPNPSEEDIDPSLKEITEHGNSLFPFAIHFTNHDQKQPIMIHTHWHRELEILYITSGRMEVIIEGNHFIATEGDILLVPPNLLHGAINYQQSACAFFAIVFDSFFINSHLSDLIQQSYFDPILNYTTQHIVHATSELENIDLLQTHASELIESFAIKKPYFELTIKAHLLLFFQQLYEAKDTLFHFERGVEQKDDLTSYKCKKVLLYLEENYKNHISLEDISNHIGFSREHFCRFFKQNFQLSFFTYLNSMRVKKAEYLLINTQLKIIDIALESGFENSNYFTTVFKKETGLTPTAYRKNPNNVTLL